MRIAPKVCGTFTGGKRHNTRASARTLPSADLPEWTVTRAIPMPGHTPPVPRGVAGAYFCLFPGHWIGAPCPPIVLRRKECVVFSAEPPPAAAGTSMYLVGYGFSSPQ